MPPFETTFWTLAAREGLSVLASAVMFFDDPMERGGRFAFSFGRRGSRLMCCLGRRQKEACDAAPFVEPAHRLLHIFAGDGFDAIGPCRDVFELQAVASEAPYQRASVA